MAKTRIRTRLLAAAAALPLLAGVTACGSDGDGGSGAGGTAEVTFWGWAPGYEEAAAQYNATHQNSRIKFEKIVSGSKGGYAKIFAAVKAGNAPCLAQVGYESLPSFVVEGAAQEVGADAGKYQPQYGDAAWSSVKVGGRVYGIPVDLGPMGLYYRTDLYAQYGLKPQATWEEFAADAAKVRSANPNGYLSVFNPDDPWWFAGMSAQAGGNWFGADDKGWKVALASDPGTAKVAKYWQGLVDQGLVKSEQSGTPDLYKDMQDGTLAAYAGPVWFSSILEQNAAQASGKWGVAPMPQWQDGAKSVGNDGGSSTALIKGCKNTAAALEFANWMSTDPAAVATLVEKAGIYPASTSGASSPALAKPSAYFGNRPIFDVFKQATAQAATWNWGPTMTQTSSDLTDAFGAAVASHGDLTAALGTVQSKTVDAMKAKGLTVTTG
ncbi:extracellular solute-binding protein [Kitasatospora purpeofusca]|uniref:extracellular solute-binding protein n=1 Tax=Kitasatospora purpeofusca TaxID=67352 RepID=UPI002A5A2BC4|nr:extracellular solute-binding protein [Kitasatospora purpeofusca]MDY0812642.1 extracellular solute-binding protein [Kitasatospora purpeofusca]